MQQPGPAQLELIRRYARTLRQMQTEAIRANRPAVGARENRTREQAARFPRGKAPVGPPGSPVA